jgi:hypothetical protein
MASGIREIGGRIPWTAERHVFTGGATCTEVPELTLLRGDYSLLSYLEGPSGTTSSAKPSLNAPSEPSPFGETAHNRSTPVDAFGELPRYLASRRYGGT